MTNRLMCVLCVSLIGLATATAQEPGKEILVSPVAPLGVSDESSGSPLFSEGRAAGNGERGWVSGDFLFAWMRGTNLPPLVTTSPVGTPRTTAGVLGAAGTTTLFGDSVDDKLRPGFRLGAGYWFNPQQTFGIETGVMLVGSQTAKFSAVSNDGTILARPFFDINGLSPQAVLVAFPGSSNGSIDIQAKSGSLFETHLDITEKAIDTGWLRLSGLIGYRYFRYDESLRIQQTLTPTNGNFIPGTQALTNDNFSTHNDFQGIDLGYRWQFTRDAWSLEVLTKVAVGRLYRSATVAGDQTVNVPGVTPVSAAAGVLALGSNSGTLSYADWRAIPEFGATLGWQVRPNLSVRFGYTFMYFNAFARAADQVDTIINTNFFPGSKIQGGVNQPRLDLHRSDFWLQTANVGVEWTF